MIRDYSLHVDDEVLDDLHERLVQMRLPEPLPGEPWSRGMDLATLRTVIDYWRDEYDWRAQEKWLNQFPQFIAEVDGVDIHFFHVRGTGNATPLLLIHGWPGSAVEFANLIGPLTDPAAHGRPDDPAFDVVIPSIPGYGFSGKPTDEGWNLERVADAFDHLMTEELGYRSYGVQGGDWGAMIATVMGIRHPDHLIGLHLNLAVAMPPEDADPAAVGAWGAAAQDYTKWNGAYAAIQQSRPMSLTVAQTDSPAGLAAWILEKFHFWSDVRDSSITEIFSLDELVTNLMFYWAPKSIASAAAFYYENYGVSTPDLVSPVTVPVGYARFPAEMIPISGAPDEWYERRFNIQQLTHFDRGGHFAALERPDDLLGDIRRFYAQLSS